MRPGLIRWLQPEESLVFFVNHRLDRQSQGQQLQKESQKKLEMVSKLLSHLLARSRRLFNEGPISIARGLHSNIDRDSCAPSGD